MSNNTCVYGDPTTSVASSVCMSPAECGLRGRCLGRETSFNTPQPAPARSTAPAAWDLVLADISERDAIGTRKYGQRLTPYDGRDSLIDAYQEALDLVVYLRKALYERDGR